MWEMREITFSVPDYKIDEIDKWAVVAGLNKDSKSADEVREEFINDAIALLIGCLDMSVDGYRICGINSDLSNERVRTVWTDMEILANARQRRASGNNESLG